jgi:hypothetical protein
MKKIMMIAAMMLMSIGTFAQNEIGQFTLKPKAGINLATMTDTQSPKMRVGAVAGVEGEYGITETFGLSAGVLYSMQGVKFETSESAQGITATAEETWRLDYINIPILAKAYLFKGFAVNVGVQPGFCVSKKFDFELSVGGQSVNTSDKLKDGIQSFAFSIPLGLSYEYEGFVLDARYNWGITKAFKSELGFDSKHSWFQFTLGYKIPF